MDPIGVEIDDMLGDRVSPGYGSLDCYIDYGTETDILVKDVAGTAGTDYMSSIPKSDGHGRWDTVRPMSGSFMLV